MKLNLDIIGKKFGPYLREYDWKDLVLYALGVGSGFNELEYVYEKKLKVLPSFGVVVVVHESIINDLMINGLGSNPAGFLHMGNELIIHNPIPAKGGTLYTEAQVTHIYDRGPGKGAQIIVQLDTCDENGLKLFTNISKNLAGLDGGFGGEKIPRETIVFPDRYPDFEQEDLPSPTQPLIYRLLGDTFELHVDPNFARSSGFERPIMHGLCTFGFACRALIKYLFPGEPERLERMHARFSKPLYPGEPIKTQIWKNREGKGAFRVLNVKTGKGVLDYGVIEWKS